MKKLSHTKITLLLIVTVAVAVILVLALSGRKSADTAFYNGPDDLPAGDVSQAVREYSQWLGNDFTAEHEVLRMIRSSLADGGEITSVPSLNIPFDPNISYTGITLFQPPNRPLRYISKRASMAETLNRVVELLRSHERFGSFDVTDVDGCRIMLEVVTDIRPLDIERLSMGDIGQNRFEPGITGFRARYDNRTFMYMPTNAVVYSHLSPRHALNYMAKKLGLGEYSNRISDRIRLLKELPIEWWSLKSVAFITYGDGLVPLYRGYPVPVEYSNERVYETARTSIKWLLDNMTDDGRFLYYYGPVEDTIIDHIHPNRTEENNYYNILRHGGGIIALLKMYEFEKDKRYLSAADKALRFLAAQIREHNFEGQKAYYVYFNQKAKLGGTGVALVAFLRYRQASQDTKYDEIIHGLARHLLSRICEDGEMLGYYIHPHYNDGRPITDPNRQQRRALFSFYYPGEALLGLALYDKLMPLLDESRERLRADAMKALDFLVEVRPVRYAEMFEPLPSDGWLMQAIEQWAETEQFRKDRYIDFVFNDADAMVSHMYTVKDALYYDYPGSFYYHYGDHAYPDGARGEGLIAAYYLAEKLGEDALARKYLRSCKKLAHSLLYLYNSDKSTYMHKVPRKSIGSFRFKLTRQWVRVDSVQHVACFYLRLYPALTHGYIGR